MTNNRSRKRKTKNKASAQPKPSKKEADTKESGLKPEDIPTVLEKDVNKDIFAELNATMPIGESFAVDTEGKKTTARTGKTKKKKVDPLPTKKVMEVLTTIFQENHAGYINKGAKVSTANKFAGATFDEFIPYLDLIVPDEFEPRNKEAKSMKINGEDGWKKIAVRRPAVNRRLKELIAKGTIIVYSVANKFHLVPTQCIVKNVNAFINSAWHIIQIKNILFHTKQWKGTETPYYQWFKPNHPLTQFGFDFSQFEKFLSMDHQVIYSAWTNTGWDQSKLSELLKT